MLALELAELSEAGYDLALTGFEDAEIEALLADVVSDDADRSRMMPTNRTRQTTCRMRQWCRCRARRCLGHRLAPIDLRRRHRPAVVAALMQGDRPAVLHLAALRQPARLHLGGIADWDGLMRGVFAQLPMATTDRCWSTSG
jgi:hypothetical protein